MLSENRLESVLERVRFVHVIVALMAVVYVLASGTGFDHPGWLGWSFAGAILLLAIQFLLIVLGLVAVIGAAIDGGGLRRFCVDLLTLVAGTLWPMLVPAWC